MQLLSQLHNDKHFIKKQFEKFSTAILRALFLKKSKFRFLKIILDVNC